MEPDRASKLPLSRELPAGVQARGTAQEDMALYSFELLAGLAKLLDEPRYRRLAHFVSMAAEVAFEISQEEKRRAKDAARSAL